MSDSESDAEGGSMVPKRIVRKAMKRCGTVANEAEESVSGGKVHFMKSMKKLGKDFGTRRCQVC
jgi:hypothetical protein